MAAQKCERCGKFASRIVAEPHPYPGNAPHYVCERCSLRRGGVI